MHSPKNNTTVLPFLKWAGGKRWLAPECSNIIPSFTGRYIEPFLGSGAIFFYLQPADALLSDTNEELIETFLAIQNDWMSVLRLLEEHHKNHCKEYYYKVRSNLPSGSIDTAARFIYLNRTCWNGLYRVNLRGQFNVPIGTKTKVLLDTDRFDLVSESLKKATIMNQDFEETINAAKRGDFLFIDPPYTVKHNHNGFIKYNEKLFSWDDQMRLKNAITRAVDRGAMALITNASHDSIKDLYRDFIQIPKKRKNAISGKSEFRGHYDEILIKCGYS
ncbi:DNA adenine methylase [Marinobacter sp. DUT-1]|uniref:DNA adenine methylase n=1 Tax=Marinobacter sp. DUT-1 TaxID=3412037 RepID=UPI003D184E5B